MKIVEKLEYGKLATFIPNKSLPIYNWFYFKEGFSRDLVIELLRMSSKGFVLDPFCGSGTTLLACKEKGINAVGFDTMPLAVFVTRAKTNDYNGERLKKISKELLKERFKRVEYNVPKLVSNFFPRGVLDEIFFFKRRIMKLPEPERDFFLLALISASMKCSFAKKEGSVVKKVKKNIPPLRTMLRRQIYRMIKDLQKLKTKKCRIIVEEEDARTMDLEDIVDTVITSPPYLNKIDYPKLYRIENELFFPHRTVRRLRSFIGLSEDEEFNLVDSDLPAEAKRYFKDMYMVIENLYRACKKDAKVFMVVGNGCFPSGVVESDIILSELAENVGFHVDKIIVLNKRVCTTPSRRKIGISRESVLVWVKK